jgi:SAM-dependent methyltransferase
MDGMSRLFTQLLLRYLLYIYEDTVARRLKAQGDFLENNPSAVLVDCGCGDGTNTEKLARRIGTHNVFGIEIGTESAQEALKRRAIPTIRADLNDSIPLQSNSVNVVTALDVLEHLVEPDRFVSELHRVLCPGGYVTVATPNLASWHNIFALTMGVQPFSGPNITSMEDAEVGVVHKMHRQIYNLPEEGECQRQTEREARRHIVVVACKSLVRLFDKKGFVVERLVGFGYYPFPPPIARLLSKVDKSHSHHLLLRARKPLI